MSRVEITYLAFAVCAVAHELLVGPLFARLAIGWREVTLSEPGEWRAVALGHLFLGVLVRRGKPGDRCVLRVWHYQ
jgi:hypothetical protein